jgi:copper resistance protein D
MFFALLDPDATIWDGIAIFFKAAYYITSLGAAGLAMFALGFGQQLTTDERHRIWNWTCAAIAAAFAVSSGAGLLNVHIMSGGQLLNFDVWATLLTSRLGDAFYVRHIGLLLILLPLTLSIRAGQALAGAGIFMVLMSYALMGHSTKYAPRQELASFTVIHVGAVAFWIGSLLPLAWVAKRGDKHAALLIADWSRLALLLVPVLAASGGLFAVMILHEPQQLFITGYGRTMIAKVVLFCLALGIAAYHKLALTDQVLRREPGAGNKLARSIKIEAAILLLVFYAAAEMVSNHPPEFDN